ncbi:MAG: hypothetical protein KAY32_03325 [Candidatus Eisenbacteria sp.]|nr:hypothetical protein [Candidatus Eisenbacteria bacterium]
MTLVILGLPTFLYVVNPRAHVLTGAWVPGTPARSAAHFFQEVFVERNYLKVFDHMDDASAADEFVQTARDSFIDIPRIRRAEALPARGRNDQVLVLIHHVVRSRLGLERNAQALVLVERKGLVWKVASVVPEDSPEFRDLMGLERRFRLLEGL